MAGLTPLSRTAARVPQPAVARLGALFLAASVPVLLLHVDYQPHVSLDLGGTDASFKLSDLAVLALAAAAVAVLVRDGVGSLRPVAVVLAPAAALLVWICVGLVVGAASDRSYAGAAHLVTAAGFAEYALIAVAVPVLVRSTAALQLVLWTLVGWLAVLDVVGLAQFAGAGDTAAGGRQPSWIGYHDFAAAGATTLAIPGTTVTGYAVEAFPVKRPSTSLFGGSHGAGTYADGLTASPTPATNPAYFEVAVPVDAAVGERAGELVVAGRRVPVTLTVADAVLPPLPRSVWAYEDPRELVRRDADR